MTEMVRTDLTLRLALTSVPAPRRPLDDVPGRLAAVHPLRPQLPPGGDDPAAA
jgi:hypothetical protein